MNLAYNYNRGGRIYLSSDIIYIILKENDALTLAQDYIEDTLADDEISLLNLYKIEQHLKAYEIKNNKLYYDNGHKEVTFPIRLDVKDKFQRSKADEIVKTLDYYENSYEIRLNYDYTHPRIIFCLSTELSSYIMTFGFTKLRSRRNINLESDQTNLAAEETDRIHREINFDNFKVKWLGGDFE